jgi:hypothetical protein
MPPAGLLEAERQYWNEIEPILRGLVYEIRDKGWFRPKTELEQEKEIGERMMIISTRINTHLFMTNDITNAMESNVQATINCLKNCFGYSKEDTFNLWIYELLSIFLESTEMFTKNLMILIKQVDPFYPKMTFGGLVAILEKHCPKFGSQVADQADVVLRNSIAHGIYWMLVNDNSINFYYSEEVTDAPKNEPLNKVLLRVRKHNLLASCLSEVLSAEILSLLA